MKLRIAAAITLTAFTIGASGCATVSEEHKGAASGAGIGAATGAVAGALIAGSGSRVKGAVIGGLAGALLGGIIGHYTVDRKSSAEETNNKYSYQPTSGTVVRVEDSRATPSSADPGGTVNLDATYAVMAPSNDTQVSITETRVVTFNGELVANPEVNVTRTAGTYKSTLPLILPTDAKSGTYRVVTTMKTDNSKDSRETSFIVR